LEGTSDTLLFSESGGFILEVEPNRIDDILDIAQNNNVEAHIIGKTLLDPTMRIVHNSITLIDQNLHTLTEIWSKGLENKLK